MRELLEIFAFYCLTLSPVWALFLWNIRLSGKKWFYLTITGLSVALLYLIIFPLPFIPSITSWLPYYLAFFLGYVIVFTEIYGFNRFNKALAVSMFLVYFASEFWEMPIMFNYLSNSPPLGAWIHPLYLVFSFIVFVYVTKFSWLSVGLLLIFGHAITTWFFEMGRFNPWIRIVCLGYFGFAGYLGDKNERAMVG